MLHIGQTLWEKMSAFDLSLEHGYLETFPIKTELDDYLLDESNVDLFWKQGFLGPFRLLREEDCDLLLKELETFANGANSLRHGNLHEIFDLTSGQHPHHSLFHEFHLNQTGDPGQVLMHCLGHWRVTKGFHDLALHPGK